MHGPQPILATRPSSPLAPDGGIQAPLFRNVRRLDCSGRFGTAWNSTSLHSKKTPISSAIQWGDRSEHMAFPVLDSSACRSVVDGSGYLAMLIRSFVCLATVTSLKPQFQVQGAPIALRPFQHLASSICHSGLPRGCLRILVEPPNE